LARSHRKSQTRRPAPIEPSPAQSTDAPGSLSRLRTASGFNPDYSHVRKDLKRIGFLAGFFILAMIVGSLLAR
jgi:hypothetical protein